MLRVRALLMMPMNANSLLPPPSTAMRTMFVSLNSLDEVQMLQSLGDSALPAIYSVASGTANVAMTRR